jgi:acyl-CoA synthetase (AMP-forming)/AMP-acid ligase II
VRTLPEQLVTVCARDPKATAVVDAAGALSYEDLAERVARLHGHLRATGLQRGDRVALWLENSSDYVVALYGCWCAGVVAVPVNAAASMREVTRVLEHSGAALLMADGANRFLSSLRDRGIAVMAAGGKREAAESSWSDGLAGAPARDVSCRPEDLALILYTSGTTGNPKGVMLTHENLAANTAAIVEYLEMTQADRVLAILPFHYSYGNSVLHSHLSAGATLVIGPSMMYPQRVVDALRTEAISGFSGVPATFRILLDKTDLAANPPPLRYVTQAGGAMGPALTQKLVEGLRPATRLFVMYGQTEASARLTYLPPDRLRDKLGSVGIPLRGVEIAVVDEQRRQVQRGEAGEVIARGANVMAGYWHNPESTAAVLVGGWLRTGDFGRLDGDGFLYLEGRRSDMIKTGAHRVNPEEIEEVVAEIAGVNEVAACGLPDPVLGQVVGVFVVGAAGPDAERLILRHCREHLAPHKIPKKVYWRTSLPRTASGKIKRHELNGEAG